MKTWEIICDSLVFIILFSISLNHMYSIGKSKGYSAGYADAKQEDVKPPCYRLKNPTGDRAI